MDNSDIAAAALQPGKIGKCSCSRHTKNAKPNKGCKKCKGTGKVTACAECEGSGWSAPLNRMCGRCQGAGYV